MNIENFFEDLNSKIWKNNTESEASFLFDEFIDALRESKDEILFSTLEDIQVLQEMKMEENSEFTYQVFKSWLNSRLKENIKLRIDE